MQEVEEEADHREAPQQHTMQRCAVQVGRVWSVCRVEGGWDEVGGGKFVQLEEKASAVEKDVVEMRKLERAVVEV